MKASDFFDAYEKEDPEFAKAWADAAPARVIAGLIVRLRLMRGLTQAQLAEVSGMEQSAISRVENASNTPSWETVMRLLMALKVEMHVGRAEHDCVLIPRETLAAKVQAAFQAGVAQGMKEAASSRSKSSTQFNSSIFKMDEVDTDDEQLHATGASS